MSRFVLLEHDHPTPHLDLLFEVGEVLWAWRLGEMPGQGEPLDATRNFDHRLIYLDYEGPISGGRGRVRRVDRGDYVWRTQTTDRLVAEVFGQRLHGRIDLTHAEGDVWRLVYQGRAGG
jgi:hypothetical protein